ncbi:MAG: PadR family transcriptional regulator [Propioniciclava sp.]
MQVSKDLVAASAAPIVLGILANGENYGYAILTRIAEVSDQQFEWSEGLLYPLLHRLERQGYVTAHWGQAPSGRRRKYYRITPDGRDQLADQRRQWEAVNSSLGRLWAGLAEAVTLPPPTITVGSTKGVPA